MKAQVLERARSRIEAFLRERNDGAALDVLSMGTEVDGDGEEFLWVRLVYDGEPGTLGADTTVGLTGRLRSELEEVDVEALPVLSFIARSDVGTRYLD